MSEIVAWRRANQPGGQNAGSVFTNPAGDSAGRLIDAAGCKGLRVGTAAVSTKHANFFQADAGGSADDVVALMAEVRRRVLDHAGVDLHPETRLVGFPTMNLNLYLRSRVEGFGWLTGTARGPVGRPSRGPPRRRWSWTPACGPAASTCGGRRAGAA